MSNEGKGKGEEKGEPVRKLIKNFSRSLSTIFFFWFV